MTEMKNKKLEKGENMKSLRNALFIVLAVLFLAIPAFAADINFGWDANKESDLVGYRLYQSQTPGTYQLDNPIAEIPKGSETYTVGGLTDGTYFWVLTAFDQAGNESEASDEVTLTIDETAPDSPAGFWAIMQQIISWFREHFGLIRS